VVLIQPRSTPRMLYIAASWSAGGLAESRISSVSAKALTAVSATLLALSLFGPMGVYDQINNHEGLGQPPAVGPRPSASFGSIANHNAIRPATADSGLCTSRTPICRIVAEPSVTLVNRQSNDSASNISVLGFQAALGGAHGPPAAEYAQLVWDPAAQEAVFFGGWNGHVALNQTWLFRDGTWINDTVPAASPPARFGAVMAYDNQSGVNAIILTGGCNLVSVCPMRDTWMFSNNGWQNISIPAGSPAPLFDAAMATWGENGTLLFGGCTDSTCSAESNSTWAFQETSRCAIGIDHSCWLNLTSTDSLSKSPPPLAAVALGDDPIQGRANGEVVLYGGFETPCFGCKAVDAAATWLFDGDHWTDATTTYARGFYPSEGRSSGSLFWDPSTRALWLYGGMNDSTGMAYDQLWMTDVLIWANETSLPLPSPARVAAAVAAGVPAAGALERPLLVGGGEGQHGFMNDTWVFEPSIVSNVRVVPNPVETNRTVNLFSNTTGGTQPHSVWSMGDGTYVTGGNGSHTYTRPGTYAVELNSVDDLGVRSSSATVSVNVRLFSLGLNLPTYADQSAQTSLSVHPENGTPPYNATWSLSDGIVLYGADVHLVFTSPGTVSVTVSVRDGAGTVVNSTGSVRVNSPLNGVVKATPQRLDVGTSTLLSIQGSGGTPPYTPTWTLPDGRTSVGQTAVYRPTVAGPAVVDIDLKDFANVTWNTTVPILVNPALTFAASASSPEPSSGRSISFSTHVTGGTPPYMFEWRFGDGTDSAAGAPSHTYSSIGSFTVTVWVNDSGGGSYRQTLEVKIPRTSGGLLWQFLALPIVDQAAVGAAGSALVLLGVLVARRRAKTGVRPDRDKHSPTSTRPGDTDEQLARLIEDAGTLAERVRGLPSDDPLVGEMSAELTRATSLLRSRRLGEAEQVLLHVSVRLNSPRTAPSARSESFPP
jgi:PKD repeat protein